MSEKKQLTMNKSLLSLILLFFIAQAGFGVFISITKNIATRANIIKVNRLLSVAQRKNDNLKSELVSYNTANNLEAIARNNLKMAQENEALIVILDAPDVQEEQNSKIKQKKKN